MEVHRRTEITLPDAVIGKDIRRREYLIYVFKQDKLMGGKRERKKIFQGRDEDEACFVGKKNLQCFGGRGQYNQSGGKQIRSIKSSRIIIL